MTTDWNGPESTIPEYPSHRIGVTAHDKYMDFMSGLSESQVAINVRNPSEDMHNIGHLQIVCMVDPSNNKNVGFTQGFSQQSYGKPLGIGQAGKLPHGLSQEFFRSKYYESLSDEEKTLIKREYAKRGIAMLGVSVDSYRKAKGPDHTPNQDGVSVIMHGPCTVKIFTPIPLRPMADLVLDLIPPQGQGRGGSVRYQSEGPEKYPFTLKEHDSGTTSKWCRDALMRFSEKVTDKRNAKWIFVNKIDTFHSTNAMLEADKNGQDIAMGILQLSLVVVDKLLKHGVVPSAATWQTEGPKVLGLAGRDGETDIRGDTKTGGRDPTNLIKDIILRICDKDDDAHKEGDRFFSTQANSGLQALLNGVQGVMQSCNKIVARNLGTRPQKYGKSASGLYEYDIFVKTA